MQYSRFICTLLLAALGLAVTNCSGVPPTYIAPLAAASIQRGRAATHATGPDQKTDAIQQDIAASILQAQSLIKNDVIPRLYAKDFAHLNQLLSDLQAHYANDFLRESDLYAVLTTIADLRDPKAESYFNEWVQRFSVAYPAYLARGVYYTGMGWEARGMKPFKDLKTEEIEGMKTYFQKAIRDLERALDINPHLVPCYAYLINIHMNFSPQYIIDSYKDKAFEIDPYNVTARWNYILSLTPLWGDNIAKLESFIKETIPYMTRNPKLQFIEGAAAFAKGEIKAYLEKPPKFAEAIQYYTEAISFGDHWRYYWRRGLVYIANKQYREAVSDLDKAVQMRPSDRSVHQFLVHARRRTAGS